ncbi:MAG TPA: hypothetical protein VIL49_01910 [Capillimicrobium sp.]|jgi:hypothetical protein
MREISPGIHHWTAFRDTIGTRVSCYWVAPARILIDPLAPDEGLDALLGLDPEPQQVVLTNRHHRRDAARIADALDVPIRFSPPSQDELGDLGRGRAYRWGEEVAPGVTALEVGVLSPDEGALHIAHGAGALAVGDTLTRSGDDLAFMPDDLLGDDPQAVRDGLRARFEALLERDFDALLLAHGEPLGRGAKAALADFLAS